MYSHIRASISATYKPRQRAPPRLIQHAQHLSNMSAINERSKPLKILMLHGYTQNGSLFHAKTKVMEKFLLKVFPGIELHYPTGPSRLKPSDVPGFDLSQLDSNGDGVEAYGWWRRSNTSDPPEYAGLAEGLKVITDTLDLHGPFDGVMGFSQGAAAAAMVASLLEGESRKQAFQAAQKDSKFGIAYPASFEALDHPPLKFCISYSGFVAPGERYRGFYERPTIQTPMCHVIGSLDTVVEESRTQALVDAAGGADKTQVVMHPGGHFVPSGKQYLEIIAGFIKSATSPKADSQAEKEENVEDMDVPF